MGGLSYVEGLSDGEGLWRDHEGLWGGRPGLITGPGGPVNEALLQEDGFFLLQEDGFYIMLE